MSFLLILLQLNKFDLCDSVSVLPQRLIDYVVHMGD